MRRKGITYDTGFVNKDIHRTRPPLDPSVVRHEMRVIREDLHCDAVRVTGGDPDQLELAATLAADAGLEVWFSPFTIELTEDEMLALLADCATRAERLRLRGAEVVLVTGAELSLFNIGFLPGDDAVSRIKGLMEAPQERRAELVRALPARINDFLRRAVAVVRERFGGKLSYASIHFEGVDWEAFDFVGIDLYRTIEIAEMFPTAVQQLVAQGVAQGKPVAITEFGCCAYRGAADKGARGGEIVEWDDLATPRLNGSYERDESEQATYLRELLDVFTDAGVDSTFALTFASYHLPHRDDPREDLDMGGYGVVKVFDDQRWEPKEAFHALAASYRV